MRSWRSHNFSISDLSALETHGNRQTYRRIYGRQCAIFQNGRCVRYIYSCMYDKGLFKNIIYSIRLIFVDNKNETITTKISSCLGPSHSPKNVMRTTGWWSCWKTEPSALIWHHVMPTGPIQCSCSIQKLPLKVS